MAVTRFYTSKAIRYTPGFLASAACGAEVPVRRSFSEMRMAGPSPEVPPACQKSPGRGMI